MLKLILGTASFGTTYGISNRGSLTGQSVVKEILEFAQSAGISDFDTAPGYGPSEELLGSNLDYSLGPRVSSKIPRSEMNSVQDMVASTQASLRRTKANRLETIYLHDQTSLFDIRHAITGLNEIISMGLAERIGVSVYSLEALIQAKEKYPTLSTFQISENICDRRSKGSLDLEKLALEGNKIIVRSIFLQGLLLMAPAEIPKILESAQPSIVRLRQFAELNSLSPLDLCMSYGHELAWASGLIIGASSVEQLQETISSNESLPKNWESEIDVLPHCILDPRKWN